MDASKIRITTLACAAVLAGCAMQGFTPEESALAGAAVRNDVALQTIDPAAGQRPVAPPPADAKKTVATLDRYRKDQGKVVQDSSLIKDVGGSQE